MHAHYTHVSVLSSCDGSTKACRGGDTIINIHIYMIYIYTHYRVDSFADFSESVCCVRPTQYAIKSRCNAVMQ
jgi:hypothetical protein